MSGGVAYVLDEDGTFEQRCNMAQVALEPRPKSPRARARATSSSPTAACDIDHLTMGDELIRQRPDRAPRPLASSARARDPGQLGLPRKKFVKVFRTSTAARSPRWPKLRS